MAVFGPQLIYTVVMFVLLSKLGKFYSFGRYLLCTKLFRYLSPSAEDIKKSVRKFYNAQTGKNKKLNRLFEIDDKKEEFNIPEGAEVEVACAPVAEHDLYYLRYTEDLQSFVDISCIALFIYGTTEVYYAVVRPADEVNLSVVWCGMALMYGFMTLGNIALNYTRTDEGSLLYVFAALSFMISMLVQLGDTRFFDFNLKDAFHNVTGNTMNLIQAAIDANNETESTGSQTKQYIYNQIKTYSTNDILFSCFIATISGLIGSILFFPSFRLARLHFLCLKHANGSSFKRLLFYLNFLMPLAISLCWVKAGVSHSPLNSTNSTSNLTEEEKVQAQFLSAIIPEVVNATNATAVSSVKVLFSNFLFASNLKIYLAVAAFVLRLSLYRYYAQAYLNVALELAYDLRKNGGKITNTRYMQTISSIYQYYGVVACQYLVPLFCLILLSVLLKTLGSLTWCGDSILCNELIDSAANYTASFKPGLRTSPSLLKQFESANFNLTMSHSAMNEIFTPYVLRSFVGYFTFWTSSIWFMMSCFGLMYYQYVEKQY